MYACNLSAWNGRDKNTRKLNLKVTGELDDEGFAARVDREERSAMSREGAHVDHSSFPSRHHGGKHRSRHIQHRVDVTINQSLESRFPILNLRTTEKDASATVTATYLQEVLRIFITHTHIVHQDANIEVLEHIYIRDE